MTNFKHLSLAAIFAVSAIGSIAAPSAAFAGGTHSDGNGGAVCKGSGACLLLSAECKGKYIDATQSDGTVYGKCTQVMKVDPKAKLKLR